MNENKDAGGRMYYWLPSSVAFQWKTCEEKENLLIRYFIKMLSKNKQCGKIFVRSKKILLIICEDCCLQEPPSLKQTFKLIL